MLIARSTQEAHLYMDLHACACGARDFEREHRLEERDGALVAVYEGVCPQCGRTRSFTFVMSDELPPAPPAFGGAQPSRIIDPGEFLWVSDQVGTDSGLRLLNVPPTEQRDHRASFAYALAALDEVLKFLPEGAGEVPAERFTSDLGRELYRKDATRFSRARLLDNQARKQRILAGVDRFSPPAGA
ncbi:hypothetical protein BKI49_21320 [Streptomyces sp. Tue6028]|uniref:hypothetical protein n=1 Tax=Streptomyces sp. Tue6028 TaxID=2036037 RepID=UPI000BB388CB|nr:hypothetical protein [Streptomyces sp. Tue6028]PBC62123.1 hypothetical protein BKI49_21320 [Streptomyces sp. Tue6028]